MQKNIDEYLKTTERNLKFVQEILTDIDINNPIMIQICKELFTLSSQNITNRWLSGRKYARTSLIKKIFGDFYPQEYFLQSLFVDAMVNILDDLTDDQMNNEGKMLYLVEFGRVLSLYSADNLSGELNKKFSYYLNKLLTLAVAEKVYIKAISEGNDLSNLVALSIDLLKCRSLDVDIFIDIALLEHEKYKKKFETIKQFGRIFRALNILKKDLKDIDHDVKNQTYTAIVILTMKKNIDFSVYVNGITGGFMKMSDELNIETGKIKKNDFKKIICDNFYNSIKTEISEINEIVKVLNIL